ncbi:MAG: hypothetical protein PVI30_22825 [Myxococcales bacterium]
MTARTPRRPERRPRQPPHDHHPRGHQEQAEAPPATQLPAPTADALFDEMAFTPPCTCDPRPN